MGVKRKPKQKQKQKTSRNNEKQKKQILLQHYFPNLCENKSKVYQNVLKKPNGVMKQQKKFCKQLLNEQTLIIKQMNSLFNNVFKDADHEVVNQLAEIFIAIKSKKDVSIQKQIQSDFQQGTRNTEDQIKGQILVQFSETQNSFYERFQIDLESTETVQNLKTKESQKDDKKANSFLVDLEEFQFNPIAKDTYYQKKQQETCEKTTSFSQTNNFHQSINSNKEQQIQVTITNHILIQTKKQAQDSAEEKVKEKQFVSQYDRLSFQFRKKKIQHLNNQTIISVQKLSVKEDQDNEKYKNPFDVEGHFQQNFQKKSQKISQFAQKLKNGIDNIFNLMQKKQKVKQEGIKFQKYIDQLKKQQKQFQQIFVSNQSNKKTRFLQGKIQNESEIDHDQMAFSQIYPSDFNYSYPSCQQFQQFDILDFILHRNQNSQFSLTRNEEIQTQIYDKNQEFTLKDKIDDETSTNQKSKTDIQICDSSQKQAKKFKKNKECKVLPLFQLPQQYLIGYSKQRINSNFFRKIHQCEFQKIKFIHKIQQTLI